MENREERQSRRRTGKQKRVKRTALILCAILILGLTAFSAGSAYAKYVYNNQRSDVVKVKEFYFTSDLLGRASENKTYTLNPGETSFDLELRNSADALRVSTADIAYTLTVTPNDGVTVVDEDSGALPVASDGAAVTKTITLNNLKPNTTYTVTAVGKAGFEETLTATFTTKATDPSVFKYLDTNNLHYVVLTVWTKDVSGALNIQYLAGLIPDNTDMPGALTAASGTQTYTVAYNAEALKNFYEEYSSHTYRFFTETPTAYTAEDFVVTVGGKTADEATP